MAQLSMRNFWPLARGTGVMMLGDGRRSLVDEIDAEEVEDQTAKDVIGECSANQ